MTLQTNVNLWNHLIFEKKTKNEAYKAKMYWLSQENKKLTPLLFKTIFFFLQTEFFFKWRRQQCLRQRRRRRQRRRWRQRQLRRRRRRWLSAKSKSLCLSLSIFGLVDLGQALSKESSGEGGKHKSPGITNNMALNGNWWWSETYRKLQC